MRRPRGLEQQYTSPLEDKGWRWCYQSPGQGSLIESWNHEGLETRMLPKVGRGREKCPHPPSFQPPASYLCFSLAEFGWKPGSLRLEGAGR